MSKYTVFLSVVILYMCCLALGLGDSGVGAASTALSGSGGPSPKNVRILSPAATRLYRILRRGVGLNNEDEDSFSEDENYLRKRQYDDYGHMRFGKRNQPAKDFDDYGHLRFGK